MHSTTTPHRRAFSLIELLVVIAVIAVLISILLPGLRRAREYSRSVVCSSNIRQLVTAWTLYAGDYDDMAMPLAYLYGENGSSDRTYWWGAEDRTSFRVEYHRGFIAPYLDTPLAESSVLECPNQPWETYDAQGQFRQITSTYGYNGYYLSPPKTPGWDWQIGDQLWKRVADLERPEEVFIFADTLLPYWGRNSALLDPPMLYQGSGSWMVNHSPTTAFRHSMSGGLGDTITGRGDGSVHAIRAEQDWIIDPETMVGSVGTTNDPHYVPDWEKWR